MRSKSIKSIWALYVGAALVLVAGLLIATELSAQSADVYQSERFELGDGVDPFVPGTADVSGAESQPGFDWDDLFRAGGGWKDVYNEFGLEKSNGVPDFLDIGGVRRGRSDAGFIADDISVGTNLDSSIFVNSGVVGPGTVTANYDLGNVYSYTVFDKLDLLLYTGLERLAGGTGSTIFEFTRNLFSIDADGAIVGDKSAGDLQVRADYTAGALTAVIVGKRVENPEQPGVFEWTVVESLPISQQNPVEQCNDAGSICVVCNAGSVAGGAWENYDATGAVVANLTSDTFMEIGINLSSLLGVHTYDNFYSTRYAGIQITTFDDAASPNPKDYALGSFVRASKLAGR